MEVAYSFIRFSSREQRKWHSTQRQNEIRDGWLSKHNVRLLEAMSHIGSAFKGLHRQNPDTNDLARFLAMVESGEVKAGTFLIIEALDRLTREEVPEALELVLGIMRKGIRIAQLLPVETIYDSASCREPMKIMMMIMELSRGNSESKMKSDRVGLAWAKKKANAKHRIPLGKNCPQWLTLVGDHYEPVPAKVKAVLEIFRLCREGYGLCSIVKELKKQNIPNISRSGKDWCVSYVDLILNGRAVLGEYQLMRATGKKKARIPTGEVVQGYYPAIMKENDWLVAQSAIQARKSKAGRPATKESNIFAGLLKSAHGGTVGLKANGKYRNLMPYQATQGYDIPRTSFPLEIFENLFLSKLEEIRVADILPKGTAASPLTALEAKNTLLKNKIEKMQRNIDSDGEVDEGMMLIRKWKAERQEVLDEIDIEKQKQASPLASSWGECQTLVGLVKAGGEEIRMKLRGTMRRIISDIWCLFVKEGEKQIAIVQVFFKGSKEHRGYGMWYQPGRSSKEMDYGSVGGKSFSDFDLRKFSELEDKDEFRKRALLWMMELMKL